MASSRGGSVWPVFIDDRIGERQKLTVAGRVVTPRKAYNVRASIRKAAFGYVPLLCTEWQERDVLDPSDAIGQVNENVRLAAGAAQLEVEVVSTLFLHCYRTKKRKNPLPSIKLSGRNGRLLCEIIGAAGENQASEGTGSGSGL